MTARATLCFICGALRRRTAKRSVVPFECQFRKQEGRRRENSKRRLMGLCGLYKKLPKSQKSLQTFIMVPRKSASIEKARRLRLKSPIYTAGQKNSLCGSGGRAVGEERERERDCVCSNHTHTHTTVLLRQKALPPDSQREGKKERERFCGHLLSPSLSSYSPPPLKEKGPSLLSLSPSLVIRQSGLTLSGTKTKTEPPPRPIFRQ